MGEFGKGTLHSGKGGPVVKNRKQAVAIAISSAKKASVKRKKKKQYTMSFQKKIYTSGPRMGTNNSMYGIDAAMLKKKPKRSKAAKSSRKKK